MIAAMPTAPGTMSADGPTHPPDALGPGVTEGAGLQLPGQQRRTDEGAEDAGEEQQHRAEEAGRAVLVVELLVQVPALGGVAGRASLQSVVRRSHVLTRDDQAHREQGQQGPPY